MEFFRRETRIDFMRWRNLTLGISVVLVVASLVSVLAFRRVNLGVEFSGGVVLQVALQQVPDIERIRTALARIGQEKGQIQRYGAANDVLIRLSETKDLGTIERDVRGALAPTFPGLEIRRVEAIGPQVSRDLVRQALLAILYALGGILIYVGFRFKFAWGAAGVLALLHDVIVTLGVFSFLYREITLPVVAALLTIAGYSINDTIVIFDRVRENTRLFPKETLPVLINKSVNQMLGRTVITTGVTLLTVIALFLWGGEILRDFSFALIVGMVSGVYSTVFYAAPIVVLWTGPRARRV